jgi:hypothetical protein
MAQTPANPATHARRTSTLPRKCFGLGAHYEDSSPFLYQPWRHLARQLGAVLGRVAGPVLGLGCRPFPLPHSLIFRTSVRILSGWQKRLVQKVTDVWNSPSALQTRPKVPPPGQAPRTRNTPFRSCWIVTSSSWHPCRLGPRWRKGQGGGRRERDARKFIRVVGATDVPGLRVR